MAIDYCYISFFIIVDRYACASKLREIIPHVLLIAVSLFEHVFLPLPRGVRFPSRWP